MCLELASDFYHDIFAYDLGGGDSRPSDLQACIIEGMIFRRARLRLGKNPASRKRNSISREQELSLQGFASDFGVKKPD